MKVENNFGGFAAKGFNPKTGQAVNRFLAEVNVRWRGRYMSGCAVDNLAKFFMIGIAEDAVFYQAQDHLECGRLNAHWEEGAILVVGQGYHPTRCSAIKQVKTLQTGQRVPED